MVWEYSDTIVTIADYGVIKEYEPEEGSKVGKTVKYDERLWTILYDDDINGLQMISNQSLPYNNYTFSLGIYDSSINDWSTVTDAEFDGKEGLSNFEKAVYSYNNAIDTLNNACESMVAANSNIIDVRCVGSNPTNKSAENETLYTSDNLKIWPINNSNQAPGIGNERVKSTDTNYVSDIERMVALGIHTCYDWEGDKGVYLLASRCVEAPSDLELNMVSFNIRYSDGKKIRNCELGRTDKSNASGDDESGDLRPVVSLNPNVQFTGEGTTDSPYTFE